MKKYMGKYTKKQIGFVIGMILGDGYITKNYFKRANSFLGCRQSKKQKDFLLYKKQQLENLGFKVSKLYDTSNNYGESFTIHCNDKKLFNQLRLVLYPKNNKIIKRKWLNYLTAKTLAIWYMDDGSLTKRGKSAYISLHTNGFNKKEHDIIIKYFKQVWKLKPTLRVVKRNDRKQTYFLTFPVEETLKFINIVKPYIIPSMFYKVDFKRNEQPNLSEYLKILDSDKHLLSKYIKNHKRLLLFCKKNNLILDLATSDVVMYLEDINGNSICLG